MRAIGATKETRAARLERLQLGRGDRAHGVVHAIEIDTRARIDVLSTYIWEVRPANGRPFTVAIQKTRPASEERSVSPVAGDYTPR